MGKFLEVDRFYSYAICGIGGFFAPIQGLMLWLLIFVICDMITGIWASLKEGEHITSHKLQRTVIKIVLYLMCVALLEGLDHYMLNFVELNLARLGASLVCGIELYSILENCYRITKHEVFKILTTFTLKKMEEHTGVKVEKKDGE